MMTIVIVHELVEEQIVVNYQFVFDRKGWVAKRYLRPIRRYSTIPRWPYLINPRSRLSSRAICDKKQGFPLGRCEAWSTIERPLHIHGDIARRYPYTVLDDLVFFVRLRPKSWVGFASLTDAPASLLHGAAVLIVSIQ